MKTFAIVLLIVASFFAGCAQEQQGTPRDGQQAVQGQIVLQDLQSKPAEVKEFTIRAYDWGFDPDLITVNRGDRVRLLFKSDVEHGFAIAEYGIDVAIKPGSTVPIEFVADKPGTFTAYCSVFCGQGHSDMRAKLDVK